MTLRNFEFKDNNHFVAMEYYNLILNRTFLVLRTGNCLIGLYGNGIVSTEGGNDVLTKAVTRKLAIRGDLSNPYSYLKGKYIDLSMDDDLDGESILHTHKSNFRIAWKDIQSVHYDPKKKWGMGPYPHDGKVYVKTINNKQREFIILGDQSGREIASFISASIYS